MNELINAIIENGKRKFLPDAYILGQVTSVKRDYQMVERVRGGALTGAMLAQFEDGLMVQDSRHAA